MSSIAERLAAPFESHELKHFPAATNREKTQGKVATYADARVYMERLDAAVGPGGWETTYRILDAETKAVECQLRVQYETGWAVKADVGYPNEARDADDASKEPLKAAYSDALKRAAVQHGVGRFIYSIVLERDWLPIDQYGKFTQAPRVKAYGHTPVAEPSAKPRQAAQEAQQHVSSEPAPTDTAPAHDTPVSPSESPRQGINQLGEFEGESGGINMAKFVRYAADQGVRVADIAQIAPHPSGRAEAMDVITWLRENPGKTCMDLAREARELKEGATQQKALA